MRNLPGRLARLESAAARANPKPDANEAARARYFGLVCDAVYGVPGSREAADAQKAADALWGTFTLEPRFAAQLLKIYGKPAAAEVD